MVVAVWLGSPARGHFLNDMQLWYPIPLLLPHPGLAWRITPGYAAAI